MPELVRSTLVLETIVSDDDQRYSGDNFRGPDHASPYPVSRLGAPVSLVD